MEQNDNTKYELGQKPQALEQVQTKHRQETTHSGMERLGAPEHKANVPNDWEVSLVSLTSASELTHVWGKE